MLFLWTQSPSAVSYYERGEWIAPLPSSLVGSAYWMLFSSVFGDIPPITVPMQSKQTRTDLSCTLQQDELRCDVRVRSMISGRYRG